MKNLGATIKSFRLECGLDQSTLAQLLGTSQSNISKWELNKTEPSASNIIAMSNFFEISSDELLGLQKSDANTLDIKANLIKNLFSQLDSDIQDKLIGLLQALVQK